MPEEVDTALLGGMRCPRDFSGLQYERNELRCEMGHSYPVVDGIPIMLLPEKTETLWVAKASARAAEHPEWAPLYLETVALSEEARGMIARSWKPADRVDAVISYLVGATSGRGYTHLIGKLSEYPIPDISLGAGNGGLLLDIGSSWGRWSVSAARKGWRVIAMDPSLGALLASRRAFAKEGLDLRFVCGDARHLPFAPDRFQAVYSYSVLQHFSEPDAEAAIAEMGRVLGKEGTARVQMAQRGLRYRLSMPRDNKGVFRVRFWSVRALREVFGRTIGPSTVQAEAFGGLLREDFRVVSPAAKALIGASSTLKALSRLVPPLTGLADSVFVIAVKR